MKKTIIITTIIITIIASIIVTHEHHYTKEATITTTVSNGYTVATDNKGEEWAFYSQGLECGDRVVLIMDDNNTLSQKDDLVVGVEM